MKKLLSIILSLIILLSVMPIFEITAFADDLKIGSCGDNVTYSFDSTTGTLTISGTGAMTDYTYSEHSPFYQNTNITSVIIDSGVTTIGAYIFYECSGIASISIPETVTQLKTASIRACTSLTSLTIPNSVNTIESSVFYDCTNLQSVNIPDGLTKINNYTFCECKNLQSIEIPNSVTQIGDFAFNDCSSLTEIAIPESVTSIGRYAFFGCSGITNLVIPNSVESVGEDVFRYCTGLTNVVISNRLNSISDRMFQWCENISNVYIPESVNNIGVAAFGLCTNLSRIYIFNDSCVIYDSDSTISSSATIYGYKDSTAQAYSESFNRTFITLCDGVNHQLTSTVVSSPSWTSNGTTTYTCETCGYSYDETTYLSGSCGNSVDYSFDADTGTLTISGIGEMDAFSLLPLGTKKRSPFYNVDTIIDVVIEYGVENISSNLFNNCDNISTIQIPASVTSISNSAFSGCKGINSFAIDVNNAKYSVLDGNLYNKEKTTIIKYASGKDDITFNFPETVTTVYPYAFTYATNLTTITLPLNVSSIGTYAFSSCKNLSEISIINNNCDIYNGEYTIYSGTTIKSCSGSTAEAYATTYSRSFEAIGHQYEEVERVEPESFTVSGYIKRVCSVCGNEKTEPLVIFKDTTDDYTNRYINGGVSTILPAGKSCVYNGRLFVRFDRTIANYSGIFSSNMKFAELTDLETYDIFKQLVVGGNKTYYIVGGIKSGDNWINQYSGTAISSELLQWNSGEPSSTDGSETQLSIVTSNGLLNDISITSQEPGFIVSIDKPILNSLVKGEAYYKTNKYTYFNESLPYIYDKIICEYLGGNLATVTSSEENNVVKTFSATYGDVVLGAERNTSGNFEWVTGEPFSYTNWASGEPNNSSNYNGQFFVHLGSAGTWDDDNDKTTSNTKSNNGFVCEYEPTSLSVRIDQDASHTVVDSEIHIIANYPDGTSNDITDIATFTKTYINGCCEISASATKPNGEVIKCTQDIPVEGEHTYVQQTVTSETCTKVGKVANICSICKSRYDEIVPATGHSYIVSKRVDPTCISTGYVQYTCSVCGDKYRETFEVLGHSFNDEPETVEATCSADGSITYTCFRCGETKVEMVESQGHQYIISETVEATCTQAGYNIYTCSVCGETYNEITVAATGHNYVSNIIVPTCTERGYTEYTCSVCDISYQSNYTNELHHNFETYIFNNDATDLFDGTETAQCTRCDAKNTRNIKTTTIYSENISAIAGSEVSVPVKIKNNAGEMGFALEFEYDASVLTPISVTKGSLITSGLDDNLEGDAVPGKLKVVWYGTENLTDNGILLYLNFTVSDKTSGNTSISVNYIQDDTFNENFDDIVLTCESIDISVINTSSSTWYQGVLTPTSNEVTAGTSFCIAVDGNASNSELKNATHVISFDNTAFTFLGYADANQHLVQTSAVSSTGEITLVTNNGNTYNARTPGEVFEKLGIKYLLFKANDYANSGNYSFSYSISGTTDIEDVSAIGCDIKINASETSEIANIYIENGLSGEYTDTVSVPVYISNNKGLMGYMINFEYNPNDLEIVLAQRGSLFPGNFNDTIGIDEEGAFSVLWNGTDNVAEDGVLITLTFRVLTDADVISPITITYSQDDTFNSDYDDVVFNCISGSIHLNEEENHSFVDEIIASTPNSKGYTKHICINCGYSYIDSETDYANDMSALIAAIAKVREYNAEDYSEGSYNQLQDIYKTYLDYPNKSIPQTTIDNATSEILTAISKLVPYLYLTVKSENGTTIVDGYETTDRYSVLFGESITLTAIADEGYIFDGWYETVTKRIRSYDETITLRITSNTDFEARFIKEQSATLTFQNESGWIADKITKTVSEWSNITSIDDMLPDVPYRLGFTNGRWIYENDAVIQALRNGNNVVITPEYDETNYENPVIPTPIGNEPALDLYYQLDEDNNVGSFTMAAGIPTGCQVESIGIAFYYNKATDFNPSDFDLNINNKMVTSKFDSSNENGIYIVDVKKFTSYYNWSVKGYVTYYDSDNNLRISYSNQINIIDRQQIE